MGTKVKISIFFCLAILGSFTSNCQVIHSVDSSKQKEYDNPQFSQSVQLSNPKSPGQYLKEQNQLNHSVISINTPIKIRYNNEVYLTQLKYSQTVHTMLSHLHPLASERMIRSQSDFPLLFGN